MTPTLRIADRFALSAAIGSPNHVASLWLNSCWLGEHVWIVRWAADPAVLDLRVCAGNNEVVSLTDSQRRQTAKEMRANLSLSGLDEAQLGRETGWDSERLASTLKVDGAAPIDIWRLRDVLERAVIRTGKKPAPFTVLTESARSPAKAWFGAWS